MIYVRRKVNITVQHILCALVILPFFEPSSIDIFVTNGVNARFFSLLADFFLAGRMAVSSLAYMWLIRRLVTDRLRIDRFAGLLFIHIVTMLISGAANGSADLRLAVQVYTNAGFLVICLILLREYPRIFLEAAAGLFGILSVCGCASIFLHPAGYFQGERGFGYYFLGGNNTAFPYYYCFILCWIAVRGIFSRDIPRVGWILGIFIASSVVVDSTSSGLCLSLMLAVYLIAQYAKKVLRGIRPSAVFLIILAIVVMIYVGMVFQPFAALLRMLGRTVRFSGRDVLWDQALGYFRQNPLFGAGSSLKFTLDVGVETDHAHSQYLNRLAKFGLLHMAFLAASLAVLIRRLMRSRKILLVNVIGSMLVIYLLHMAFDDYSYTFFLLAAVVANCAATGGREEELRPIVLRI